MWNYIKKYIGVLGIVMITISCAYSADIEKNYERNFDTVGKNQYRKMFNNTVSTVRDLSFYIVNKTFNNKSAYFYGCNAVGQKKIYTTFTNNKNSVQVKLKITVEGPLSEGDANTMADELAQQCFEVIERSK